MGAQQLVTLGIHTPASARVTLDGCEGSAGGTGGDKGGELRVGAGAQQRSEDLEKREKSSSQHMASYVSLLPDTFPLYLPRGEEPAVTSQHHLQAQQESLVTKNSAHRLNKVLVLLNAAPLPREPVQNKGPPGTHQPAEVGG